MLQGVEENIIYGICVELGTVTPVKSENRRDVRVNGNGKGKGKGIGTPKPLYKLFLLSPWVLFRVVIYRLH